MKKLRKAYVGREGAAIITRAIFTCVNFIDTIYPGRHDYFNSQSKLNINFSFLFYMHICF